jgi:signal transduction histidine kinase
MLTPERLLHVIARLEHASEAEGRRLLLDYLRKSSGARRCLLFLVEEQSALLLLLARSGRLPAGRRRAQSPTTGNGPAQPLDPEHIPLTGIFGSVVQSREPLYAPTIHGDARSLQVEQYWATAADRALICPVGQPRRRLGVLVLCFPSDMEAESPESIEERSKALLNDNAFQVCLALLSAYLSAPSQAQEQRTRRSPVRQRGAHTTERRMATPDRTRSKNFWHNEEQRLLLEEERARIARDLHDGLAQELTHVLQRLELTGHLLETAPERAARELAYAHEVLEQSLATLRETIATLAPASPEEPDFEMALRGLLYESRGSAPELQIESEIEEPLPVPPALETTVLHILQEGLNNVRRHAQASKVSLTIRRQEDDLLIQVRDNGRGLTQERASAGSQKHLGLRLMRERVRRAGGSLSIESTLGRGTTLEARFPLAPAERRSDQSTHRPGTLAQRRDG